MKEQIIFHGGCLGCTRQQTHDIKFCIECKYFDCDDTLPNLSNEPPSKADTVREALKFEIVK